MTLGDARSGPVTVVTTLVIASVLAGSGYAALKVRRANLEADLGREAHEIADRAARRHRAARQRARRRDRDRCCRRVYAAREHDELFQLEVLSVGGEQRTDDDAWLLLMRAADIQDAPVGRLFDSSSGPRSYAMAVPLYDADGAGAAAAPPGAPPDRRSWGCGATPATSTPRWRPPRAGSFRCSCWW